MNTRSILHINTHDSAGGAAKVAWRLAEWQRARGDSARLLVGCKRDPQTPHSISFDPRPCPWRQSSCARNGELFYEYQGSHLLGPAVATHQFLHLHNLHGGYFNPFSMPLLANLRPTVWTLHDMQSLTGHCAHSFECERWATGCGECPHLDTEPALQVDRTSQLWREKAAIYQRSPVHLVVPSRWLLDKVQRSALRHLPVHLIPNGLDTEAFQPRDQIAARRRFGLPESAVVVGAVAHGGIVANPWKGWSFTRDVLATTLKRFPQVYYVNIGGEAGAAPPAHPRIRNIPQITDEVELSQAYSALDLFLYTPAADNCPLVVLEALACGVPLATFDTGGTAELARDGREALVAPRGDTAALAARVQRLIEDRALRQRLGAQARQTAVQRFDREVIRVWYDAVYDTARSQFERRAPGCPPDLREYVPEVIRTSEYRQGVEFLASAQLATRLEPPTVTVPKPAPATPPMQAPPAIKTPR